MEDIIKIRIGNDIPLIWKIYTQGESGRIPYNLEGRDIKIVMTNQLDGRIVVTPEINENAASWNYKGKDQKILGEYTLTFYENFGQDGMKCVDKLKPFALVPWQEIIQSGVIEGSTSTLEVEPIVIESNLGQIVDYNNLINKPAINHIVLIGDKTLEELGIASAEDLAQENARAQSAEQELASAIGAEAQRAREAESALGISLTEEQERAEQAEGELSRDLAEETQRATQAETANANAISAEVTRATGAEGGLSDAIAAETQRATGAENNLNDAIEAEETRAKAKEAELEGKIDIITHPYTSLERISEYLYKVTFDRLPEDNGGESPVDGGCSSYVKDGKLYTNLDWDYDNTASFIVETRDFEGQSFIGGLNDGQMDDALIAQLPYRIHRGINNYGIKVASHILYNDWSWTGCGERSINLTRLPFLVLSRVKSMATISQDLNGILGNLYCPEGLSNLGYLLQILVTDGTTSYVLMPPTSESQGYVLQNITSCPKLANFRWVNKAEVTRAELQDRPTGVERWNMMPCPLADLRFTKAYEAPTRLSEFIGLRGTTKDSTDAELEAIYTDARAEYLQRERDGKTWQTMESAVYGDRLEALYIQEDWSKNLIPATTEYVDKAAHELGDAIEDEVERATEAEGALSSAIDAEVTRATAAEQANAAAISQEATRAQGAEAANTNAINAESQRAQSAESNLSDAIGAEETRAKTKETELGTAIATETSRAQGAESNLSTAISTETSRATTKEGELATAISQEATRAGNAESGLDTRLTAVEGKIPSQASPTNQLADKSFVNSSIATETAHYIYKTNTQGEKLPFDSVAELEAYRGVVTNNDYAFVKGTDSEGNSYFDRYKATDSQGTITWAKEYRLNNSSFTAAQWAAINSGLSGTDKAALDAALAFIETFGNIVSHNVAEFATASQGAKADTALQPSALTPYRTSSEQDEIDNAIKGRVSTIEGKEAGWDGKQDAISDLATIRANASAGKTASDNLGGHTVAKDVPADAKFTDTVYDDTAIKGRVSAIENKEGGWDAKYDKPSTGIPKTDLATDVKESLGKADSALQQHQSLAEYRKASQQDTIDAQKASKTELQSEEQTRAQGDTALATRMDNLGLSVANGMLCITYNV